MTHEQEIKNRRILVIDDNPAIHADFRKILGNAEPEDNELSTAETELFGSTDAGTENGGFELTSAYQGQDGLAAVVAALEKKQPFAMAFVDVRMPPGWDGVETITRLWEVDPDLQIVVCTAYSDYSWDEMTARLGKSDRMVILKKPFDVVEVLQLANAFTEKWTLLQQSRTRLHEMERLVRERTCDLELSNEQLLKEIKEREATERQLRATQEKLNHFLSKNPAVIFSLKREASGFAPVWISENFFTFTGLNTEEWHKQTPGLEYVEEADRGIVTAGMEKLLSDGQVSLQYRVKTKDGSVRWVRDDRRLVTVEGAESSEIVGCWTDITGQRLLEERLHQAQKMESVGQLAGGVAHDFNNLLMVILGHVEVLLNYEELSTQTTESLHRVQAAAERASNLTRQLLAFSRKQVMRPRTLDLNDIIGAITKLLGRTLGENITLTTHYAENLPTILADRSMVEQIIMNLAINSRDAMYDGGQIIISTSAQTISEAHQLKQPDSHAGNFVCLTVRDTGCGIPPENLSRIFEPFFTTKEVGRGTGLGLATVYGNVKQHNGWVEVESEPGKGTVFKVYLPVSEKSETTNDTNVMRKAVRGGQEGILVVEDESSLSNLIKTALKRQGYDVHTAVSGSEALASWAARLDEIDLLITDIVMPDGLNGWELAKEFQSIKPTLNVIYMSGYNNETATGKLAFDKELNFLEKPFSPRSLAQKVRDCLDKIPINEPESEFVPQAMSA